ncbi:MAG: helix-hairpin-helix domain-containing protein [Bacteroidota bacterium]|nr:helix-hairpin-helix domain-containing protein [Bacteroidota bacterium]
MKKFFHSYFDFSRGERLGIILLSVLLLVLLSVQIYFRCRDNSPSAYNAPLLKKLSELERATDTNDGKSSGQLKELSSFDPNTASAEFLYSILPGNVAHNIIRYRQCGGHFYDPEDVRKIYGMNDSLYQLLRPYLVIPGNKKEYQGYTRQRNTPLSCFNPNTITQSEWVGLGLSDRQAAVIRHYIEHGGQFKSAEDIRKMFVISPQLADRLMPYVDIPFSSPKEYKFIGKKAPLHIELNSADTSCLVELKGVGSTFARRIIRYREELGGFYDKRQLLEVLGLTPEVYVMIEKEIYIDKTFLRKIDLNFSSAEELSHHPYLNREISKKIVRFRSKYGMIRSPQCLMNAEILSREQYEKLEPYLIK